VNSLRMLLIILAGEKVVQHAVVTAAFAGNWRDIDATVVVSPLALLVLGATAGVAFAVALWGLIRRRLWAVNLLVALALFDLVGEFVAQGRLDITCTVSFLVAGCLLVLALIYRRRLLRAGEPTQA
jgi:hypothetical protein